MEENENRRKNGLLSDLFITSINALTKNGELVNMDGTGNRIAAQIFGPKKVLLIVGKNKIVENIEDGYERIKNVVVPKNIKRLNKKALQFGKTPKYSAQNIMNKMSVIFQDAKDRINIILVNENLGF